MPRKPLIMIHGVPMVQRVWQRCAEVCSPELIYIATEDKEIEDFCVANGMLCVNTGPAESAIDRIKLFSDIVKADIYINIQGDEPLVNQKDIITLLEYSKKHSDVVVFGKTKANHEEFQDLSKAKVVCSLSGRLLYSSRAGLPVNKKGTFVNAERAIWLYSFNKQHLDAYHEASSKVSLEKIEDNEVIRFLEIDIPVYCIDMIGDSWAVDEVKDVEVVEKLMTERGLV